MQPIILKNHVALTPALSGKIFQGFSHVTISGAPMRNPRRPWFVNILTPDGIELSNWQLRSQQHRAGTTTLSFSPQERTAGLMEWMVHEVRNRVDVGDWPAGWRDSRGTTLRLSLRPVTRVAGGRRGVGFSYQFRYASARRPIYRILDRATWEPGGAARGCELWFRNGTAPSIFKVQRQRDFYSTEWYLPGIANPNIFQFQPWQTQFQGLTFTASADGVLVTWATAAAHIRTLIEKPRGADHIGHFHEHCGDLAGRLATSPVEVVWFPGRFNAVERANLYEALRELVSATLHRQLGFRRERVTTYGVIEEWGNADLQLYRRQGLPKLLKAGARTIFTANHFYNNMNTYGTGNMCCTVDWRVADSVGEKNLAAYCRAARRGGARVEMWGNTALSSFGEKCWDRNGKPSARLAPIPLSGSVMEAVRRSRDPYARNPSGAVDADHYAPVFMVLNLRDATIREHWLRQWRALRLKTGVGGIFLDSSFNLSSDKFHWIYNPPSTAAHGATIDQTHLLGNCRPAREPRSAILSQYHAHLSLMAEMQRQGFHYTGEDLGVFGVSRSGPAVQERLASLHLWGDTLCVFDGEAVRRAGAEPDDVFFQGLACRMMWYLWWIPGKDSLSFRPYEVRAAADVPKPWHLSLLQTYNEVEPLLFNREILPDWNGVRYSGKGRQVVWAFKDFTFKAARREIELRKNTVTVI